MESHVEDLFQRADLLLFKEQSFDKAELLYRQILEREPSNIDALNSMALCLKYQSAGAKGSELMATFNKICAMYQEALRYDKDDVEANFNLGLLFL